MNLKQNQTPSRSRRLPSGAVAIASAVAIAASASGAPNANASTHQGHRPGSAEKDHRKETPLRALRGVIARLQEGKPAKVTADYVGIPGPVGNAQARPIEFSAGKKTYFAYTQESEPDFHESPAALAASMAIVEVQLPSDVGGQVPVTEAHLNKQHLLVDTGSHTPVGYSIGGESP